MRRLSPGAAWMRALPALVLFALGVLSIALLPAVASAASQPDAAPLNPAFVQYQKAVLAGRQTTETVQGGHELGLVPAPMLLPDSPADASPSDLFDAPATFDLRTLGKVSPVKDQDPFGTCWTFATLASLESSFLPGTPYDFSEDNVARTAGFDWDAYDGGGNSNMSTADLAKSGPVFETDDAYGDYSTPAGLTPRARLQDSLIIVNDEAPTKDQATDIAAVKDWLQTGNALFTTMEWSSAAYSPSGRCYYGGTSQYDGEGGHAVTIVGWDDAFSASNFASQPPGDGAWIVKNSWGSSWGDSGYFYFSYYDYSAERFAVAFEGMSASAYTGIYQYDPLGWVGSLGYAGGATPTVAWGANDFTATSSDPVTMVGFYTPVASADYELYTASTHGGTRTAQGSGTLARAGYHTVALSSPLAVTPGQSFSVILKLTTPGFVHPVAIEYAFPGYSSQATSEAGQSFLSPDGISWDDVGSASNATPMNICIKAFSAYSGSDTTPPTTTAIGVPAGWATGPVTVGFTADDGAGVGVQATLARVDHGTYEQGSSILVSADGTHTVQYYSVDKAGNAEPPKSVTVKVDATKPVTAIMTVGNSTGWTNVAPLITLHGEDGASGPALTQYRRQGASVWTTYAAPFHVTTQGQSTWEYRSVDVAGNIETPVAVTFRIDSRRPVTTGYAATVRRGKTAALRFRVTDKLPGCAKATVVLKIYRGRKLKRTIHAGVRRCDVKAKKPWRCTLGKGRYTVKVYATDVAGNVQRKVHSARLTVK